jgi:hypothetical protein
VLVIARKKQAEDHVWALREDLGYFADMAQDYRQHRLELIPEVHRKPHPSSTDHTLYSRVLKLMLDDAHICVFLWNEVVRRMTELHTISHKYANRIRFGRELAKDYFDLMVETRFSSRSHESGFDGFGEEGFPSISSPPKVFCSR